MTEDEGINCPIFQKQEPAINEITDRINVAKTVVEKSPFAEKLQAEVNPLLSCEHYDNVSTDCKQCHFITALKKEMANLIIKAKKLV